VETEDRPTQTDLAENGGDRPATNEPWPGVSQTMCTGQSGMMTTRDNGYIYDKPLKKKKKTSALQTESGHDKTFGILPTNITALPARRHNGGIGLFRNRFLKKKCGNGIARGSRRRKGVGWGVGKGRPQLPTAGRVWGVGSNRRILLQAAWVLFAQFT